MEVGGMGGAEHAVKNWRLYTHQLCSTFKLLVIKSYHCKD